MRVDKFCLFDKNFYVLRDDLGEFLLNGNKGRKMHYLLDDDNLKKMLTSLSKDNKTIISFGSNQSNAMASLSKFCNIKNLDFIYVTNHSVKNIYPNSNLDLAIKYGAKIIYSSPEKSVDVAKRLAKENGYFLINEGICEDFARYGFLDLANIIKDRFDSSYDVFLPSGTGTSAVFLQYYLKDFQVFTTPCYSDSEFLEKNIKTLDENSRLKILNPTQKFVFGGLYDELYDMIMLVNKVSNIEFELIYDSVGFVSIKNNLDKLKQNIIYIHQGGEVGHKSQLLRYQQRMKNGLFKR